MTKRIFVSYHSSHKSVVKDMVRMANAETGAELWLDDKDLLPGDWRDQLASSIRESTALICVLTEGTFGEGSSGWVAAELQWASDANLVIIPCFVGEPYLPDAVRACVATKQGIKVDRAEDLVGNETLHRYLRHVCDGTTISQRRREAETAGANGVAKWYDAIGRDTGPPSVDDQALALAIATLPDVQIDLVSEAAKDLGELFEKSLRPMTEKEMEATSRQLGAQSLRTRLDRVNAHRVTLRNAETGIEYETVRFREMNWANDLIDYVWTERIDVRDKFLEWIAALFDRDHTRQAGHAVALSLGIVAQNRFVSVQQKWLRPIMLNSRLRDIHADAIDSLLATALENPANEILVQAMLNELIGTRVRDHKRFALYLALGRSGLRRPSIAIAVMRHIGREMLTDSVLDATRRRSLAFNCSKFEVETDVRLTFEDVSSLRSDDGEDEDRKTGKDEPGPERADEDRSPETGLSSAEDGADFAQEDAAPPQTPAISVLQCAAFLAALGEWADEKVEPNQKGRARRQIPLFSLLDIVSRLPVASGTRGTRMSVEDLVGDIVAWDPDLLRSISKGFVRAAKARKVSGIAYFPPRHLERVFDNLGRRRRAAELRCGPRPDAYLRFSAAVYRDLRKGDIGDDDVAEYLIEGVRPHVTDSELGEVRKGVSWDQI